MDSINTDKARSVKSLDQRVSLLIERMTLAEKIGQMCQVNGGDSGISVHLAEGIRAGQVGSVLNEVNVETVNEIQRIAVEESRLGIPLLIGRDVIHGFKTVMPIPLGQAASWDPELIEKAARVSAREAARAGINWTFAPMIDVSRDPRWGRIAESLGEDPYLASKLGAAMVRGIQGDDLSQPDTIAACGKHFAGYGAAESGRDYASTNIPENEMRNVYLRPFRAAVDAGVSTMMTSFADLDGVPATANRYLVNDILRGEWGFTGFVVSDWDSIRQLSTHGLTANDKDSAFEAANAGVDMEMHGDAYLVHLETLVEEGRIEPSVIDNAVASILHLKFELGLFDRPYVNPDSLPPFANAEALAVAKQTARKGVVLLRNERDFLPLSVDTLGSLAVIGPLADAPRDQLGTWIFDGDPGLSQTPLAAIREFLGGKADVRYAQGLTTTRTRDTAGFEEACQIAAESDVVLLFLGEEAILSGEAHSRADIGLPGAQAELVRRLRESGQPIVAVIMAGRPLTLADIIEDIDGLLFTGHPGAMAGPAITELLFGVESPSGKLPATFPRMVGQVPIYYSQKNTGRPPSPDSVVLIDDIAADAEQLSTGMTAYHLDAGYEPLFPFGYGLSYTTFLYENIRASEPEIRAGQSLTISADLANTGGRAAEEVAQLYVRDLVGSVTRPVRELKGFKRVCLEPGEQTTIEFVLHTDDLAFFGRDNQLRTEPGEFHAWIGGSSDTQLRTEFHLVADG